MNYLLIILITAVFSLFNRIYFSKIKIKSKFTDFSKTLKKLQSKNIEYTKILDDISLKGLILIAGMLLILLPWAIIFLTCEYLEINQLIGFLIATIPYLSFIKFKKK